MTNGTKFLALAIAGLATLAGAMVLSGQSDAPEAGTAAASPVSAAPSPSPAPAPSAQAALTTTDAPADQALVIKRILPITGPIKYGEWHWNEEGAPAGPIVITVDLDARVISIFRAGYEIGAAAVLLGSEEKPTPTGIFPITQKKRHHISNLYDAPMPYMQRLTNDGIALHATTVEWGYASRGCVGMPEPFAKKVFETTKLGDRVFITRGKMVGLGDSLVDS